MAKFQRFTLLFLSLILWAVSPSAHAHSNNTTLWVITDVHHFAPSLQDEGESFERFQTTTAGMDIKYGSLRLQALVNKIEQLPPTKRPETLIISGDLTVNGERDSLIDLLNYMDQLKALNVNVYILPGNHDIASKWARQFKAKETLPTDPILIEDYANLIANYGPNESIARHNLHYVIQVRPDMRLLLLDTNKYPTDGSLAVPVSGGQLTTDDLQWIEDQLQEASHSNLETMVIMHHNALIHYSHRQSDIPLDQLETLQQLIFKYKVPLILSGHTHAQHIDEMTQDDHNVYEVITGAFSVLDNPIGVIQIDDSQISYHRESLQVTEYINTLFNYSTYMERIFDESTSRALGVDLIYSLDKERYNADNVLSLVQDMNRAFFTGKMTEMYPIFQKQYGSLYDQMMEDDHFPMKRYLYLMDQQRHHDHQTLTIPRHH